MLPVKDPTLARNVIVWFCCFLIVTVFAVVYFRIPLLPLLIAGALTLAATFHRYRVKSKK